MNKPSVVIAGGSGLIGSACRDTFIKEGYTVYVLTRRQDTKAGEVSWDPDKHWIAENVIDNASAVINLCGVSLAEKRWSRRYKQKLHDSRMKPTEFLGELINKSELPPECYIGISGIGIYGDTGVRPIFDDTSETADTFVASLVKSWEQAHNEIRASRNVILRTGVVISRKGGFLAKLIPPMQFGLFPFFGTGMQLLSWIHMDDITGMMLHCIKTPSIHGVFHATSPMSVSHRDLVRTLKSVTGKAGIVFSVPAFALRWVFGEMVSLLFESADVRPDKIISTGFQHAYPEIKRALQKELGKKPT